MNFYLLSLKKSEFGKFSIHSPGTKKSLFQISHRFLSLLHLVLFS